MSEVSDLTNIIGSSDISIPGALGCHSEGLVLEVDVEKYFEYTRHFDLPEDQQAQLIQAMWQIMKAFVDIGFEIHPAQRALEAKAVDEPICGEHRKLVKENPLSLRGLIKSLIEKNDDLRGQFNECSPPAGG